jgi:predicted tellurium resistance membrane protein TerC
MNSAYVRLQQRQRRDSALMGVLGAVLLALVAAAVLVALVRLSWAIPAGWWLPVEARPFNGRWPL